MRLNITKPIGLRLNYKYKSLNNPDTTCLTEFGRKVWDMYHNDRMTPKEIAKTFDVDADETANRIAGIVDRLYDFNRDKSQLTPQEEMQKNKSELIAIATIDKIERIGAITVGMVRVVKNNMVLKNTGEILIMSEL